MDRLAVSRPAFGADPGLERGLRAFRPAGRAARPAWKIDEEIGRIWFEKTLMRKDLDVEEDD